MMKVPLGPVIHVLKVIKLWAPEKASQWKLSQDSYNKKLKLIVPNATLTSKQTQCKTRKQEWDDLFTLIDFRLILFLSPMQ